MASKFWRLSPTTFEAGDTPPYEGLPPPHFVDRNQFYESTAEWEIDQINEETRFREAVLKQQEECCQKAMLYESGPSSAADDADPIESYRSLKSRISRTLPPRPWPRRPIPVSTPSINTAPPSQTALTKEEEARRDSTQQPLTPQSPNHAARIPDTQESRGRAPKKPVVSEQRLDRSPTVGPRRSFSTSSNLLKRHSSSDSEETETESTYRRKRERKRRINSRPSPPHTFQTSDDSGSDEDTVMAEAPQQWTATVEPHSIDLPLVQLRSPPKLVIEPIASAEETSDDSNPRKISYHGTVLRLGSPASGDASSSPVSPHSWPVNNRQRPDSPPDDDSRLNPEEIDLLHPNTVYFLGCDPTWIAHLPGPILVRQRGLPRRRWERDPNDVSTFPPLSQLTFKPKQKTSPVQQAVGGVFRQLEAVTRRWTDEECAEIVVGWRLYSQPLHDGQTVAMPHLDRNQRLKVCYRTAARFQEYLRFTSQHPAELEGRPEPWLVMRDWNTRHRRTATRARPGRDNAPSPEASIESSEVISAQKWGLQNDIGSNELPPPIPPRNPNRPAEYPGGQARMRVLRDVVDRGYLLFPPDTIIKSPRKIPLTLGSSPARPPVTPRPRNASLPSQLDDEDHKSRPFGLMDPTELEKTRKRLLRERDYLKLKNMLEKDHRDSFLRARGLACKLRENGHWVSSIPKIVDSAERDPLEPCTDSSLMEAAEWETLERALKDRDKRDRYKPNGKRPLRRMTWTSGGLRTTNIDPGLVDTDDEYEDDPEDYLEDEDDFELQEATQMSFDEARNAKVVDVQMIGMRSRPRLDREISKPAPVTGTGLSPAARPSTPPGGKSTLPSPFLETTIYAFRESNEWSEIRAKIKELRSEDYAEGQIEQFMTDVLSDGGAEEDDEPSVNDDTRPTMPSQDPSPFRKFSLETMVDWFVPEAQPAIREEIHYMREQGLSEEQIEQEIRRALLDKMKMDRARTTAGAQDNTEEDQLQTAKTEKDKEKEKEKEKENERPTKESREANTLTEYESEDEDEDEDEDGLHPLHRC